MYKLTTGTSIFRLLDSASIPLDPANKDYAGYLDWLAQGNVPLPADPAIILIPNVSPAQMREALLLNTLLDTVEAAVLAGDRKLKIWWEFATVFERNHPMVVAMGAALGQTDAQIDALFILGATL